MPGTPPDWPPADTPLPWDEPTQELPVIPAPSGTAPFLTRAALSLALTGRTTPAPEPSDADEGPEAGGGPPGRRWMVAAAITAVALVLTGITVVAVGGGAPTARQWAPPAAAAAAHTVTGPLDGRTAAAFDLVDGAGTVTVRTSDLGDRLYRVSTPPGGPTAPRAEERDGRVRLLLGGGADTVDVALSTRVRWDLRVTGGADRSTIDLTGGRVGGIDLAGGADRITLTLPEPDGTLSVRMSGGVSLFDVRTAGPVPVRVQVGQGAGEVVLDGRTHRGVGAGRTFTPRAWPAAADRVDLSVAGLAALTVAPTGG